MNCLNYKLLKGLDVLKVRSCNCTLILSACVKIKFSVPSGGDIDEQTTLLLSINFCQEEASDVCHTNNTLLVKTVNVSHLSVDFE